MKHTIKLSIVKSIVIQPGNAGTVALSFKIFSATAGLVMLPYALARYVGLKIKAANDLGDESEVILENGATLLISRAISGVGVELHCAGVGSIDLTPDQCGVLILAIECAINPVVAAKHGTTCHGDECAAGMLPCPTPTACRVAA